MNNCDKCKSPMDENINGKFCPRGCENIPEFIGDDTGTVAFDQDITVPYTKLDGPCCTNPEIEPFEVRGEMLQHCWTCGKVIR